MKSKIDLIVCTRDFQFMIKTHTQLFCICTHVCAGSRLQKYWFRGSYRNSSKLIFTEVSLMYIIQIVPVMISYAKR